MPDDGERAGEGIAAGVPTHTLRSAAAAGERALIRVWQTPRVANEWNQNAVRRPR
jgi:hypothetical protein